MSLSVICIVISNESRDKISGDNIKKIINRTKDCYDFIMTIDTSIFPENEIDSMIHHMDVSVDVLLLGVFGSDTINSISKISERYNSVHWYLSGPIIDQSREELIKLTEQYTNLSIEPYSKIFESSDYI